MVKKALHIILISFLLLLLLFTTLVPSETPVHVHARQLRCHDDERRTLLELKGSLGSDSPCFESWKMEREAGNCCSWTGVICGGPSSHVVGLDLGLCEKLNGPIPPEIGRLVHLQELSLSESYLEGPIPPSVSNLTELVYLYLSFNYFHGPILPLLSNFTRLEELALVENQFTGDIPLSMVNLTRLTRLYLSTNQFTGEIPSQIGNLIHLEELDLSLNRLHGQIPTSLFELRNLSSLVLRQNNLGGVVQLDAFSTMERLQELDLSFNNFSVAFGSNTSHTLRKIKGLYMAGCNLNEFPAFLEKLDSLAELDLSHNSLSGYIPEWFLGSRLQTLSYLNLSGNSLMGFPRDLSYYNSSQLESIDLRFNKLRGSLPLPSRHSGIYLVSNNMLSGEIPPEICGIDGNFFSVLDLSKNNFTGELPQCLGQLKWDLDVLALHSNNFRGRIPSFCSSGGSYRTPEMIDLSDNQFEGPLPRSLSNCSNITFLNVGNNKINDSFPSWLGSLPNLGVLILRSNYFHGGIEEPESGSVFPQLQIIDISFNYFQGSLPASYFQYWRYMGEYGHENTNYLSAYMYGPWVVANDYPIYDFSMTIINKGVEMEYRNILGYFKMLDLSSNNFTGNIPGSISSLHGLHLLNISNNLLTGSIPPSLGALTRLEALDLSRNDLSGEIPQQLTELKSISLLNVSYNNLSGPIPKGNQFDTFPNNSYWGNPRLCGDPLSRKCGSSMLLSPPSQKDEGPDAQFEVEWKAVAAGYAVTFVMGIVIGHKMITKHASWFAKTFGLRQLMRRR